MTINDQNQSEPSATTDRPAWLPEKFKTPEELARSYTELEKKLGQPKATRTPQEAPKKASENPGEVAAVDHQTEAETTPTDAPEVVEEGGQAEQQQEAVAQVVEAAGLDLGELDREFAAYGDLAPSSYERLAKIGITRDIVQRFIEGQRAISQGFVSDLYAIAGGPDKFDSMWEWSKTANSISESERAAVDRAMESRDAGAIKLAFKAVHAKWLDEVGQEPAVALRGGHGGGQTADVFEDMQELQEAMRDPRYKKSERYREAVAQKLQRSRI